MKRMKPWLPLLLAGAAALTLFLMAREARRAPSPAAPPPESRKAPAGGVAYSAAPPIATGAIVPEVRDAPGAGTGAEPAPDAGAALQQAFPALPPENSDPEAAARTRTRVHALLLAVARAIELQAFDQMQAFIDGIKRLGPGAVGPLLDVIIHADDTRYPIYAAVILGELQAESPDPALAESLRQYALPYLEDVATRSEDPSLRHAALVALGKIGDARSLDILMDAVFREEGAPLVDQAARSLTALRGKGVTDVLSRVAQSEPDSALRARLVAVLAGRKDPAALATLAELAERDSIRAIRLEAARGLGALATPEAREVLRDIAAVPGQREVRAAALAGLGVPGDETDLRLLADVLHSPAANAVRAEAYRSLLHIGTPRSRDAVAGFTATARVKDVVPGGNAAGAGLMREDLITVYDGEPVSGPAELASLTGQTRASQMIAVRVLRGGRTVDTRVRGGKLGLIAGNGVIRE